MCLYFHADHAGRIPVQPYDSPNAVCVFSTLVFCLLTAKVVFTYGNFIRFAAMASLWTWVVFGFCYTL